jgi:hypothetical protein
MMIDLQAHYLDLISSCMEEAGHGCLLTKHASNVGRIYVTVSETDTRAMMVIAFSFQDSGATLGVEFANGRQSFALSLSYVEGLDPFLKTLVKAMRAGLVEDKRKQA